MYVPTKMQKKYQLDILNSLSFLTETAREGETERQTDKQTKTDKRTKTDTQTDRDRQTNRDRERLGLGRSGCCKFKQVKWYCCSMSDIMYVQQDCRKTGGCLQKTEENIILKHMHTLCVQWQIHQSCPSIPASSQKCQNPLPFKLSHSISSYTSL